jgi:hypothetical protein
MEHLTCKDLEGMRRLDTLEVLRILRREGIVMGQGVIMDSNRFIVRCHVLGFEPAEICNAMRIERFVRLR